MEANQNKYLFPTLAAIAAAVGASIWMSKDDKPTKVEGFDKVSVKKRKAKRRAGAFARMTKAGTLLKKNKKGKRSKGLSGVKKYKSYEIINQRGKSSYVSARSIKSVKDFHFNPKPKKIIIRKDINPDTNLKID